MGFLFPKAKACGCKLLMSPGKQWRIKPVGRLVRTSRLADQGFSQEERGISFPFLLSLFLSFFLLLLAILPYFFFSLFLASFPLEVKSFKQLGGLGGAVSFPERSGTEPQPKSNLVHFSFKI